MCHFIKRSPIRLYLGIATAIRYWRLSIIGAQSSNMPPWSTSHKEWNICWVYRENHSRREQRPPNNQSILISAATSRLKKPIKKHEKRFTAARSHPKSSGSFVGPSPGKTGESTSHIIAAIEFEDFDFDAMTSMDSTSLCLACIDQELEKTEYQQKTSVTNLVILQAKILQK